jgi:uncharacterized protein (TIGR01777 family)
MSTFEHRSRLPVSPDQVWQWHLAEGALERLTPPWERVRIEERQGGVAQGGRVSLRIGRLALRWEAEHRITEPGREFRDVQAHGPFDHWEHTHRIDPDGQGGCTLTDHIEYRLPAGAKLGAAMIKRRLERDFEYRHRVTATDLAAHEAAQRGPLRVAVTGASGLIGSSLVPFLTTGGHTALPMTRSSHPTLRDRAIPWDPYSGRVSADKLEGVDAVIHLAGANLAEGRWTSERKRELWDSRVAGTGVIARALAGLSRPPRVLLCSSGSGYYGERGDAELVESSGRGGGFLAELCEAWEAATEPARAAGIRVVTLRTGMVCSGKGGALRKLLPPFRAGLGGPVGDGSQYWSWIALDDLIYVMHRALWDDALVGPVNAVAPTPVRNRDFARTLGEALGRPARIAVPRTALRFALGREMANEVLLTSTRVLPGALGKRGHEFRYPTLLPALRHELGVYDSAQE